MEQLKIQQSADTVIFSVKVIPRSSRTAIAGILNGMLKVKLSAAPEKGKANESLVEFLADILGVKRNAISITSGHTSPVKTIQIAGISTETILKKLVF